ncbi:hypothetical protein NHQ30_006650 [Ciborinia camelliae]|nr:hypothetical protein NHQ30_006650 [Ciborinia camelliae]
MSRGLYWEKSEEVFFIEIVRNLRPDTGFNTHDGQAVLEAMVTEQARHLPGGDLHSTDPWPARVFNLKMLYQKWTRVVRALASPSKNTGITHWAKTEEAFFAETVQRFKPRTNFNSPDWEPVLEAMVAEQARHLVGGELHSVDPWPARAFSLQTCHHKWARMEQREKQRLYREMGALEVSFDGVPFDGAPFDGALFDGVPFDGVPFDYDPELADMFDGVPFDYDPEFADMFDGVPFDYDPELADMFDGVPFDDVPELPGEFVRAAEEELAREEENQRILANAPSFEDVPEFSEEFVRSVEEELERMRAAQAQADQA